ncbi:MAG: putative rane protein [Chloroflexi bacterium]|nr:putative rane protein [Chloroflexota bacterium]
MTILERIQGPFAALGGVAFLIALAVAMVQGEVTGVARIVLAVALLLFGGAVAIDPQRAFQALIRRESRYGSNATLLTVAFIGILVIANVLAIRFHYRWDLTAQRDFSLSESTLKILSEMPQPVHATAYFSGGLADRAKTEQLLKEYEARSGGKLTWEVVDTFSEPGRARAAGVNVDGTTKFRMGDRVQDTITPDEAHLTTALIKLVNPTPLKVYFITGHGERELDKFDESGYSELKTQVQADNYVVEPVNLLATRQVPADAAAIIIAAPKSPYVDDELAAINRYLDAKGRLILMVDPLQPQANVDQIIKRWDLTIGQGVAIDAVSSLPQDPTTILVQRYGLSPIVKDLAAFTVLPFVTSVDIPNLIKRSVDVSALAMTVNDRSWLETDIATALRFDEGVDKRGPLTLAVSVEEVENPPAQDEQPLPGFTDPNKRVKNRAVIIGTSELVTNGLIKQPFGNRDFFLNSLNWVTQTDQLITTRPRIEERRSLFLTPQQSNFVSFSSFLFFPLIILGIGGVIWWTRR